MKNEEIDVLSRRMTAMLIDDCEYTWHGREDTFHVACDEAHVRGDYWLHLNSGVQVMLSLFRAWLPFGK